MPVEHLDQFKKRTGAAIAEGYGLTEASPVTHINPIEGTRKNGSIGLPFPDTEAKIVDMEVGGDPLPPGKRGELVIRGPQVMKGYYNRPDATADVLRNGWLYTGDIAYMDEEGYFYIVDRKKDLIISGGYNIYPREIDEVLHSHPKIEEAVSVGIPHEPEVKSSRHTSSSATERNSPAAMSSPTAGKSSPTTKCRAALNSERICRKPW